MKAPHRLSGSGILLLLLLLGVLTPLSLWAARPDYQLLPNPGLEQYDTAYGSYEGVDCQVASGWTRFPSDTLDPGFMDGRVFAASHLGTGHVERLEGETAQFIVSTEPYTAGLQVQVGGLTPGAGYGFSAVMLTIYQTSAQPPVHGTMIKQVGIDPTGGTDPASPSVLWSPPDDHDQGPFDVDSITAAYAEAPTVTAYIRIRSLYPSGGLPFINLSILDSTILARTAAVSATSPAISEGTTFTVGWDNAVPSPGGLVVWYDVQWMDEAEGVWHEWLTWTTDLAAAFTGERGHAYRFRARAWQRYPNGAHLFSPYRAEGDTRTEVAGARLGGRVLTHEGWPLSGATVAISGTAYAVTSGVDGGVDLPLGIVSGTQVVTVAHPGYLAPAPVYSVTFGLTETVALTWTLRGLDDVVVDGAFEAGAAGWMGAPMPPQVVTVPVHTGRGALALLPGVGTPPSRTIGVSQTAVVSGAWEPALSFWYRADEVEAGDRFNVVLTVVTDALTATAPVTPAAGVLTGTEPVTTTVPVTITRVFTPSLAREGVWHHFWCYPGLPRAYLTGTVAIEFRAWNAGDGGDLVVYLDEVSLSSTPGGPYGTFLPVVRRE